MKLFQQLLEEIEKEKPGTYAGVHFSSETNDKIMKVIDEFDVNNATQRKKLHTTLLYSRKHLPNYEPLGKLDTPKVGKPTEIVIWKTQPDEAGNTKNCLVLLYDCKWLSDRHHKLLDEHDATYDFEYQPHITLSYDIGEEYPQEKLKEMMKYVKQLDLKIQIDEEYYEDLDNDWANKSSK